MAKIEPQATVSIPTPVGPTRYVEVEVKNELFKNGKKHEPGTKVVLELFSAENFEKAGDVEILKEVEK